MKIYRALALCAAGLAIFALQSPAETTSTAVDVQRQSLNSQDYMTGVWSGTRDTLSTKGVTFSSSYVCDILGNVSGGMHQGARYDHSVGWDVNFDLEKFAKVVNTQFHISGLWRSGQNLSKAVIGNDLVTSSIFGHEQFRFYALYLERTFLDQRLSIKFGRIATGDDFAGSPLYWTFVSNAVDGCPISIPINLFFPVYPTTTWGARAKFVLNKDIYMQSGIYDGDNRVERDSEHGLDFSLRLSKGVAFAHEIAYVPNTEDGAKGLPGHYKAGIYYNGRTCRDLYSDINGGSYSQTGLAQKKHVGDYNIYLHADQLVYREKGTVDQGLTPIMSVTIGPDNTNKFPFFLMSGLIYKGLIPTRDNDVTACEFVYAKYSDRLKRSEADAGNAPQSYEILLELTHKIMITKWMYLQPDIQYIIQPGGTGNIDDAFVIGTRFGLTF